jgi:hypothetical protein
MNEAVRVISTLWRMDVDKYHMRKVANGLGMHFFSPRKSKHLELWYPDNQEVSVVWDTVAVMLRYS